MREEEGYRGKKTEDYMCNVNVSWNCNSAINRAGEKLFGNNARRNKRLRRKKR